MGYYSFNQPRRDGRLSWSCCLTDSKRFTHKVVKRPSISLAQNRESSPPRSDVLTTMLCHQLSNCHALMCNICSIMIKLYGIKVKTNNLLKCNVVNGTTFVVDIAVSYCKQNKYLQRQKLSTENCDQKCQPSSAHFRVPVRLNNRQVLQHQLHNDQDQTQPSIITIINTITTITIIINV